MELVAISILVAVFALLGRKLERLNITAPMAFVVAGAVVFGLVPDASIDNASVHWLAETCLILILFHDASTVQLRSLERDAGTSGRLLAVGFPLALLMTLGLALVMFPALGIAGAVLLAASVTPTDAGLGAPTVLNPSVPVRIRRALNVESGLNDGIATPIVLIALGTLATNDGEQVPRVFDVAVVPVVLAIVLAVALGLIAAWAVDVSQQKGLSSGLGRSVAVLAVPFVAFGLADLTGANVFITAFIAGLTFGAASTTNHVEPRTTHTLGVAADLIGYVVWFLAGGLIVKVFSRGFEWEWVLAAIAILTFLRIVPVFVSLIGSGFERPTKWFIGWFGPRGLATVVFALLTIEELGQDATALPDYFGVVAVTIVISVFAHGVSAQPLASAYGRWVKRSSPMAELADTVAPRSRGHSTRART